jgi:hypothetical protein
MSRSGGNNMHRNMDRALGSAAAVGALGLAAVVAMAFVQPSFALQAWLGAAFAWSGVPIGALGLLLLHALVGGSWGRAVGAVLSASARMLPLIAVAFLPIILAPSLVYPWAAEGASGDPVIAAKSAYLNPTFFVLRTIVYFAIWMAMAALIATGDGRSGGRSHTRLRPGIAMVVYVIAAGFAAVDWAMSVDPRYASSAFGLLVTVTNLLAALAFAVPMVALIAPPQILAEAEDRRVRNALAGLLASGVLLWAYLSFMQYLVVLVGGHSAGVRLVPRPHRRRLEPRTLGARDSARRRPGGDAGASRRAPNHATDRRGLGAHLHHEPDRGAVAGAALVRLSELAAAARLGGGHDWPRRPLRRRRALVLGA